LDSTEYREKLWVQRLKKGYNRKQLGRMIGKHADSIKDWETGRFAPSNFRDYIRWCRALDMDPMKTIEGDESL
jgi:DNA-binding XRE family transcriptional regulator